MVVKCDTLEEAEELQSNCAICGKLKFSLETHYEQKGTHYTVGKCGDDTCSVHCHGHTDRTVIIDLGDDENAATLVGVG